MTGHAPTRPLRGATCSLILIGALGDLSRRKLLPALYRLAVSDLLPARFTLIGSDRSEHTDASFVAAVREAVASSEEATTGIDDAAFARLAGNAHFVRGDITTEALYKDLGALLESVEASVSSDERNRLFYLAVPPSLFLGAVTRLSDSGLAPHEPAIRDGAWTRLVIEKPFGRDAASARALNAALLERFQERQLYRIDHYLGKETVQNVLALRFANAILEPLWNRTSIAHVQITAAETVGVEGRGGYYEEAGVVRDMFQNHLLQLLALTAMEPPSTMTANAVRDEKVKVLRSIRRFDGRPIADDVALGQYAAGVSEGQQVLAYVQEPSVKSGTRTATYAALRFHIDNWRWEGIPFYLRSGKRLSSRVSEIVIRFRCAPGTLWPPATRSTIEPNELLIRIHPDEGIALRFQAKRPGVSLELTPEMELAPVHMRFSYAEDFGGAPGPAYETLLLDVMIGDATLFARSDEVEQAWSIIDPVASFADAAEHAPELYAAGSEGPGAAERLVARDGAEWRSIG
jgi:glucose-6-phosphate 1-dehydrogenase